MSWIGVCDAEQVQEDFPYSGNIDGKEIGIYLIDGEYYALEDVCPHAYALLSRGLLSKMARWNARCMRRYSTSKPASACMDPAVATLIVTRCGYTTIRSRLPLSRRTWHERIPRTSTRRYRKAASLRHRRKAETAISISPATITI